MSDDEDDHQSLADAPSAGEESDDDGPRAADDAEPPQLLSREDGHEESVGEGQEEQDDQDDQDGSNVGSNRLVKKKRNLLIAFGRSVYEVPHEYVMFDLGRPLTVTSGLRMNEVHESKSYDNWKLAYKVRTRNFIKLKLEQGGTTRVVFYVTFKIEGTPSRDDVVIRSVHKNVARRFFDEWQRSWSPEKREAFAELLADMPSDESQIDPKAAKWLPVTLPKGSLLFQRPNPKKALKEDSKDLLASAICKKQTAKKGSTLQLPDDDDDQSSTAQSAGLSGLASNIFPRVGGGSNSFNFYNSHAPGTVTISEAYFQRLVANQKS